MTDSPLTPDRARELDAICDRFEAELKAGLTPGTSAYLSETPEYLHSRLRRELRALELAYRPTPYPKLPDRYQPVAEVARGGMGVVWRVIDRQFERPLAVKLMLPERAADSTARARFEREAQLNGSLQHPAIPPVIDRGVLDDGTPYFSTKLIEGQTLAELIAGRTCPSSDGLARFLAIFEQLCQAVGYAHSLGIIHRDLKPENVMVGAFGEVELIDWGMAKRLETSEDESGKTASPARIDGRREMRISDTIDFGADDTSDNTCLTRAGTVMGTVAYMPPEQARGYSEQVDTRSDVFSLGGILCTLLTGRPPFSGQNREQALLQASNGELSTALIRLDACAADRDLVELCKRCLAVSRDDRPRDAGEVAESITAHLADAEERARKADLDREIMVEQRKRRRVQLSLIASVFGLVVVVGVGIALASLWKTAESSRAQIKTEKLLTEAARNDALRLKAKAEKERENALHLKRIAVNAQMDLERERAKLAMFEYGRTIELAHQAWRDGNFERAHILLNSTKKELRGWEWGYVHRLCHPEIPPLAKPSSNDVARI